MYCKNTTILEFIVTILEKEQQKNAKGLSGLGEQQTLKGRETVSHLLDTHFTTQETCQLGRHGHRLLDDVLHQVLQLGRMGCCQHYTSLTRLEVLAQGAIGHCRVRIKQITLVIIGAQDGIDDLVVIVAIGMDVTADVLMRTQQIHDAPEVVGTTGIECRSDAVLRGLGRKDTRLDVVVENIVLVLYTNETLDRQVTSLPSKRSISYC